MNYIKENYQSTKNRKISEEIKPSRKNSSIEKPTEPTTIASTLEKGKIALMRLIPNERINKLKKLVQRGKDNLKKEMEEMMPTKLLPELSIHNIMPEIEQKNHAFQTVNNELTSSLLFFHQTVHINQEEGELLKLQTEKCYKKIPSKYFERQLTNMFVMELLTKDKQKSQDLGEKLIDFLDQVEFNVNLQINYKMKVFMTFVTFLKSIGSLADLSIYKISGTRLKNKVIREIVVQRSQKINQLRAKKQSLNVILEIFQKMKKLKKIEIRLMSQVHVRGKILVDGLYSQYCKVHQEIKQYCCKKNLCKFWDVTYYIERSYQDTFSKSLKNYLIEIIHLKKEDVLEILKPQKQNFQSVNLTSNHQNILQSLAGVNTIDESYEVQEIIQLVIKSNIQKQIVYVFGQGILKCTYSTAELCHEIIEALQEIERQVYLMIEKETQKQSTKHKDSLLVKVILSKSQKVQILSKIGLIKYILILQLFSNKLKNIITRELSIVNKALAEIYLLKETHPQKQEIISTNLIQIYLSTITFISESISKMIQFRNVKSHQLELAKRITNVCLTWETLVLEIHKHYQFISKKLIQLNYKQKGSLATEIMSKTQKKQKQRDICLNQIEQIIFCKKQLIDAMLQNFHTQVSTKKLKEMLENDNWIAIPVNSKNYNVMGYIIYGSSFSQIQNNEYKMLSSSILLQKNPSICFTPALTPVNSQESIRERKISEVKINLCDIRISETAIGLKEIDYRIISSTEGIIEIISTYLEFLNQLGVDVNKNPTQSKGKEKQSSFTDNLLSKLYEFICMYNTYIKSLIINSEVLNGGKNKGKSRTGKHLLLCYVQLKFLKNTFDLIFQDSNRFYIETEYPNSISYKFKITMDEVVKKFKDILEKNLEISIHKIDINPKKQIIIPSAGTAEIIASISKIYEFLKDILIDKTQFYKFLSQSVCKNYLQKLSDQHKNVCKYIMNSTGSRKSQDIQWGDNIYWKMKELEYFIQHLKDVSPYIQDFQSIEAQLKNQKRKYLQHNS